MPMNAGSARSVLLHTCSGAVSRSSSKCYASTVRLGLLPRSRMPEGKNHAWARRPLSCSASWCATMLI
jgi:hypothetical protein